LNLLLLFGSEAKGLLDLLTLNKVLGFLVLDDLLFENFLLLSAHSLDLNVFLVASLDFGHKLLHALSLNLLLTDFGILVLLYVPKQKLTFLGKVVLVSLAALLALLDLVDDLESAGLGSDLALVLAGSLGLKVLEPLDFHHEVEAFLFVDPFLFELFVFLELLIADRYNFGVEHHSVHLLYVVLALINLGLGLGEKSLLLSLVGGVKDGCGNAFGAGAVKLLHTLLALVGLESLLFLLFAGERVLGNRFLLGHDLSAGANGLQVRPADDSTVLRNTSAGAFNAASGLAHSDGGRSVHRGVADLLDGLVVETGIVVELLGGRRLDRAALRLEARKR
jgi:hypothetical protein